MFSYSRIFYIALYLVSGMAPVVGQSLPDGTVTPCIPAWNPFSGADEISSTIQSSIKGNDGLIYLGGRDGLYRIDGGGVRTWSPDFTDPQALPSGRVKALVDQGHYLWIGTNTGLARLDTSTEVISKHSSINTRMHFPAINALTIHEGNLYVATVNGGFILRLDDDLQKVSLVTHFEQTGALSDLAVVGETVLATGESGLWSLSADAGADKLALETTDLHAIEHANGTTWLASSDTLYKRVEGGKWQRFTRDTLPGLPESGFTALAIDQSGRLWVGARRGMSRWELGEPHPSQCRRSILGSDRDQDISIAHMSGRLGNFMLFGSTGRGAAIAPISEAIRLVVPGGHYESGLPSHAIWSHYFDEQGRFIAGTARGVYSETFSGSGYFEPVAPDILGQHRIYTLSQFDNGALWVGTSKGLFIKKPDSVFEKLLFMDANGEGVSPSVFSIKKRTGDILIATSKGLVVLDAETEALRAVFKTDEDVQPVTDAIEILLPISRVWSIDFTDDQVFVAGNQGAFRVDVDNPQVLASSVEQASQVRQPVGYIYNVIVTGENTLFLGTEAGLIETDFTFSYYRKISEINGRKLTSVMSSGRDYQGNIWIGVAKNGAFQYSPKTGQWQHLTLSKGLITNGVSQLGLSFTPDGMMAISNGTGASLINLKMLKDIPEKPLDIRVIDKVSSHFFSAQETYEIGPELRDMSLGFLATSFIEASLYHVDYELVTDSGTVKRASMPLEDELSFVNLSPGEYRFRASVRSTSGIRSETVEFVVDVQPYWWETILFEIAIICVFLSLIIGYFYYRTKMVEQRLDIISEERKRVAQELHDTSLQDIFGAKMLARTLTIDVSENDKSQANKFLSLLDTAINSLRASVNSLSNLTHVPELTKAIHELKHSVHFPLETGFHVEESGSPWRVKHQNRFFVYRIVREAVNNSAKHAHAKNITVSLVWSPMHLRVKVTDDGKGFARNPQTGSTTYGMNSMICMAENARMKLNIHSLPDKGTEIELTLRRVFA